MPSPAVTAFVLGGGGILGAAEVGMLRALLERSIQPDLILGCSVGALNGVAVAADPTLKAVERLTDTWGRLQSRDVFSSSIFGQINNVVRHGTYLHGNQGLRRLIDAASGGSNIEDLPVRFQCVAASIERAGAHWFASGPADQAVLASCSVPGLFPPVRIDDEHFMDGGLVASVPVGRAVELGATRVFVLQVGRLERRLRAPSRPWEVAQVAFEIARRHQFVDDVSRLEQTVEAHILPSGGAVPHLAVRYRDSSVGKRIEAAYGASSAYLERLSD